MSHPERLKKFAKLGVQGAKPLAGVAGREVWGTSWDGTTLFPSFAPPAAAARGKKRSGRGDPCNPPQGLAAPLNPAEEVFRALRNSG